MTEILNKKVIDTTKRFDSLTKYYPALGRFVFIFAQVEFEVFLVLCHYAKVSQEVGRAVFSGAKTQNCMDFIRRIFEAKRKDKSIRYQHLKFIFAQVAAINSARNDILHYGAQFENDDENLFVSNAAKAHVPEKANTFPTSSQRLNNMITDCINILTALRYFHLNPKKRVPTSWKVLKNAWLYKHQPNPKGKKKDTR